jgi:hypothetical protein
MPERPPPDECANCGASIPRTARSCPECGAEERTGWREADLYDGLDLPGSAEDAARPSRRPLRINGVAWYWWLVGVLLLTSLVLSFLPRV